MAAPAAAVARRWAAAELLEIGNITDFLAEAYETMASMTRAEALEHVQIATSVGGPIAVVNEVVGGLFEGAPEDATLHEHLTMEHPHLRKRKPFIQKKKKRSHSKKRSKMPRVHRHIGQPIRQGTRARTKAVKKIQSAARKMIYGKRRRAYDTPSTAIASTTPSHLKAITMLKRVCTAPAPTSNEAGATFEAGRIRNSKSKTSPNGSFGVGWEFQLDQLFNYTEYTNTYQWYKILYVKLYFYPSANNIIAADAALANQHIDGNGSIIGMAPHICLAPDRSTGVKFFSMNEAMSHAGAVFHVFNDPGKELTYYCTPKPTSLIGSAGNEVQTIGSENPWVSTQNATVPYYGLRGYFENFNDHMWLDVKMEMKVAFKGVKQ